MLTPHDRIAARARTFRQPWPDVMVQVPKVEGQPLLILKLIFLIAEK